MGRSGIVLVALTVAAAVVYNGPGGDLLLLAPVVGGLLLLTAASIWRWLKTGTAKVPFDFVVAMSIGWLVWLLATTFWSHFPQLSWYYACTIGTFPLLLILWLCQPNANATWRRTFPWLLGIALLAAIWGLAQYGLTGRRVTGPLLDFNAYGALLYLFIFALLPLLFHRKKTIKRSRTRYGLLLVSFTILCLAVFATYSRGAIGVLAMLCVPFYLFARRRYANAGKTALVLILIAVSSYGVIKIYPQHTIDRNWDLAQDSSLQSRLMMWHSMLNIYRRHPWLGTGIATFKQFYPQFRNPKETGSAGDLGHNDYIQFLQEQGPIGLAFLLAIGLVALWISWRLFQRREYADDLSRGDSVGQAFGLSLGVLGLFMQASINFIFYVQPLAVLGGLFLAQAYRTAKPITYRNISLPPISRPVAAFALFCVFGLPVGGLFLDGVIATVVQNQGNLPGIRDIANNPKALYRFAMLVQPLRRQNIEPRGVIARHYLAAALDKSNPPFIRAMAAQGAEQQYIYILKAQSGRDASALSGFARLVTAFPGIAKDKPLGWRATPDNLLDHAIKYDPTFFPAYRLLAQRYEAQGERRKALNLILNRAFRWFAIPVPNAQRQRVALMEQAVNLSLKLNENARARALAQNLLANDPGNAVATKALANSATQRSQTAG